MEIKEGMYVRTTKGIGKVIEVIILDDEYDKYRYVLDMSKIYIFNDDDILAEPSYKIIDVIEEGDLVEITSKYCEDDIYKVNHKGDGVIGLDCFQDGTMYVDNTDIKAVLTKEQFAARAYEVKHDKTN